MASYQTGEAPESDAQEAGEVGVLQGTTLGQPMTLPAEVVPPDHAPGEVPPIRDRLASSEISVEAVEEPDETASDAWPQGWVDGFDQPQAQAPPPPENLVFDQAPEVDEAVEAAAESDPQAEAEAL